MLGVSKCPVPHDDLGWKAVGEFTPPIHQDVATGHAAERVNPADEIGQRLTDPIRVSHGNPGDVQSAVSAVIEASPSGRCPPQTISERGTACRPIAGWLRRGCRHAERGLRRSRLRGSGSLESGTCRRREPAPGAAGRSNPAGTPAVVSVWSRPQVTPHFSKFSEPDACLCRSLDSHRLGNPYRTVHPHYTSS